MEYTVQFLLMELESVGNIRLEEGCSTDPWYVLGIKYNYNHHEIKSYRRQIRSRRPLTHSYYVIYPTGLHPVATSCCPASLIQTLRFTASLALR